ncbi:carboxypeptidase-like regulatory domain-containing protein [Pedobacter psychrodurus]|nr:carboxypeptidase-like regulatory domain-containing protein [Pedobacter psychrodurus]
MKNKLIFVVNIVFLCFFSNCAINRNDYSISKFKTTSNKIIITGLILDAKSKIGLGGSGIQSTNYELLGESDYLSGKYKIEILKGTHTFHAVAIGYNRLSTKKITVIEGDSLIINFRLKEALQQTVN